MNQEQLNQLLNECIIELEALNIPIAKQIRGVFINKRAKSRFGCCKIQRAGIKTYYQIEVSAFLLAGGREAVKDVIFHELLHTCPDCMNHGARWKKYAALVNQRYKRHVRTANRYEDFALTPPADREAIKYHIVCTRCGARIERKRKSKIVTHPQQYRCGRCGGRLQLQEK